MQENIIWEWISHSEEQTARLGCALGRACQGGEIILLDGPLGAGKTCLTGGIAQGLGIGQPAVSPTFVILRSYRGNRALTLHHLDFYRLGGDEDLDTIGLEDCFADDSVIVAEWPGRCPHAFEEFTLWLRMDALDEATRRIQAIGGSLGLTDALRQITTQSR